MKNNQATIIPVGSKKELPHAAEKLLHIADGHKIFLFFGNMGVGKTTFIKAICKELGVDDVVQSPTYSIVNEYKSPQGPVYHFDFYRLKNETEALDLGFEDYLSGNFCLIEWPEKIISFWPEKFIKVELKISGADERLISATVIGKWIFLS